VNILILDPGTQTTAYTWFAGDAREPLSRGGVTDAADAPAVWAAIQGAARPLEPDVIGVRALYTGAVLTGPTVFDPTVRCHLAALVHEAPLHLPRLLALADHGATAFPGVPVVLVSDTAFFAALPERERRYAVGADRSDLPGRRRYGYHGLFHEAACLHAARSLRAGGRTHTPRVVSVCLEPRPEVVATVGRRPVMVTSGSTPLEGIPGHTTCGDLDPSIVLALAQTTGWGPEQINTVLTRHSGLAGLVGHPITFDTLFRSTHPDLEPVRQIIRYRLLLACGAAVAALGGLDTIVFSGRYASLADTLGPWLASRLPSGAGRGPDALDWVRLADSLERLIADHAATVAFRHAASTR